MSGIELWALLGY